APYMTVARIRVLPVGVSRRSTGAAGPGDRHARLTWHAGLRPPCVLHGWGALAGEDLLRDADGRHRSRPAGVERQVDDHFLEFRLGQAVVLGPDKVRAQL